MWSIFLPAGLFGVGIKSEKSLAKKTFSTPIGCYSMIIILIDMVNVTATTKNEQVSIIHSLACSLQYIKESSLRRRSRSHYHRLTMRMQTAAICVQRDENKNEQNCQMLTQLQW